jgi:hypothetical protein
MRRLLALSLIGSAVAGCGPVAHTAPTTGPAAVTPSPTLSVGEAKPTVAARKTWTREEIQKWWNDGEDKRTLTTAAMKQALGPPESTREVQLPGGVYMGVAQTSTAVEWTYSRLSVDADGSGKVDRYTRFLFAKDGTPYWQKIEFVP